METCIKLKEQSDLGQEFLRRSVCPSSLPTGGNLTEAINTQRALNKRLSHTTALMLFKQLLEVLVYLKERNILHEDLKGMDFVSEFEVDRCMQVGYHIEVIINDS